MIKVAPILLALLLLTSCSSPAELDEAPGEYTPAELDCGGKSVTILHTPDERSGVGLFPEESDGSILGDALTSRTKTVEELYNVDVKDSISADAGELARRATLSGETDYDCFLLPQTDTAYLTSEVLVYSFSELKNLQLDQPWWKTELSKPFDFAAIGDIQAAVCDLSPAAFDSVGCIFFDRSVIGDKPYKLAQSGKWTLDELLKLQKEGGTYLSDEESAHSLFIAAGENLVEIYDRRFRLTSRETLQSVGEKLCALYAHAAAEGDKPLFVCAEVGDADRYPGYGILPLPKLDKDGEYRSLMTNNNLMLTFSITTPDIDMTAAVIDALAYYGTAELLGTMYSLRAGNDNDLNMLKLIRDSRTLDLGSVFGIIDYSDGFAEAAADNSISDWLSERSASMIGQLERLNEILGWR